ncbi:S8 family serine peptidase [Burkholderiaceae bacterium UC74_6]
MKLRLFLLVALAALPALPVQAQLRLPGGGLPRLPEILRPVTQPVVQPLRETLQQVLSLPQQTAELLKRHPRELTTDPQGHPIVRSELLALPSSPAARERLLAEPGVALIEETNLDGLDLRWLLLRADTGLLPRLRELDPQGQYDYQHIYLGSGTGAGRATPAATKAAITLGLLDSGVAGDLKPVTHAGCDGQLHAADHGTAVASLLLAQGADLLAADAYCDAPDGGSVQRVAQGLAWLAREGARVVNVSLVGPPNVFLQRTVTAAQARGMTLVAAVGNDGPAAPPLYPAAWPGVVAVTGVDARRRVLAEAGRGPHVMFAAQGADLCGRNAQGDSLKLRGTSFAAPLVAFLIARDGLERTRASAIDLGAPGRDDIYGWGLVGQDLTVCFN